MKKKKTVKKLQKKLQQLDDDHDYTKMRIVDLEDANINKSEKSNYNKKFKKVFITSSIICAEIAFKAYIIYWLVTHS